MTDIADIYDIFYFITGAFGVTCELENVLKALLQEPTQFIESFAYIKDDYNSMEKLQKSYAKQEDKSEKYKAKNLVYEYNKKGYKDWKKEQKINKTSMQSYVGNDNFVETPLPSKEDMLILRNLARLYNVKHRMDGTGFEFATYEVKDENKQSYDPPKYAIAFHVKDASTLQEILSKYLEKKEQSRAQDKGREPVSQVLGRAWEQAKDSQKQLPDRNRHQERSH